MAVPTGSVFGLLGPDGAGKTTCLRLLAGLTRPTAGAATVAGREVATDVLAVRRSLRIPGAGPASLRLDDRA